MNYQSTKSNEFLETTETWFSCEEELLVLFRYSHAAGNRSWEFFRSFTEFQKRLESLPERTCVIVFRKHELNLRGVVDTNFIEKARNIFPAIKDCLLVCEELTTLGSQSWYHEINIDTIEELEEELEGADFCLGKKVAIGPEPQWHNVDTNIVDGVVPLKNGDVETGVY